MKTIWIFIIAFIFFGSTPYLAQLPNEAQVLIGLIFFIWLWDAWENHDDK